MRKLLSFLLLFSSVAFGQSTVTLTSASNPAAVGPAAITGGTISNATLNANTVAPASVSTSPAGLTFNSTTAGKAYTLGSADWNTMPVPFIRPNSAGPAILDVLGNGLGHGAHVDIGTDYIFNGNTNSNFLSLGLCEGTIENRCSTTGKYGFVVAGALGTGGGGVGVSSLVIGNTLPTWFGSPNAADNVNGQWSFYTNIAGLYGMAITNGSTAASAGGTLEIRNSTATNSYLRSMALSQARSSNGGFVAGAGVIELGGDLTQMSLMTRSGTAPIVFYAGGYDQERVRVPATGGVQWASATEPTCNSTNRGTLIMVQGGTGVADTFRACAKDASDTYAYRLNIAAPPPSAGAVYVLCQSAVAVSAPADTTEDTLYTCTVPANAMGPNGTLRITAAFSYTNSANSKTPRIRFGGAAGTAFVSTVVTTSAVVRLQGEISNRNATASQVSGGTGFNAAQGSPIITSAVDTTAATTVVVTCQKASAGESCTLERVMVELMYGA